MEKYEAWNEKGVSRGDQTKFQGSNGAASGGTSTTGTDTGDSLRETQEEGNQQEELRTCCPGMEGGSGDAIDGHAEVQLEAGGPVHVAASTKKDDEDRAVDVPDTSRPSSDRRSPRLLRGQPKNLPKLGDAWRFMKAENGFGFVKSRKASFEVLSPGGTTKMEQGDVSNAPCFSGSVFSVTEIAGALWEWREGNLGTMDKARGGQLRAICRMTVRQRGTSGLAVFFVVNFRSRRNFIGQFLVD